MIWLTLGLAAVAGAGVGIAAAAIVQNRLLLRTVDTLLDRVQSPDLSQYRAFHPPDPPAPPEDDRHTHVLTDPTGLVRLTEEE